MRVSAVVAGLVVAPTRVDGRPIVSFEAEDVPRRVRRTRTVTVGVAYRSDGEGASTVCLFDSCGGREAERCFDVAGSEAFMTVAQGFKDCDVGAHSLTAFADADGSSSATLAFEVYDAPMVEATIASVAETAARSLVTTEDVAVLRVAVAADARPTLDLELCVFAPCADDGLHHGLDCEALSRLAETAFEITVGFENCEPGQKSVYALALPAGYAAAHERTALSDLWHLAGAGWYDEVVFTVAWDARSAANLARRYFEPGEAPDAFAAARAYTTGGQRYDDGRAEVSSWRRQAALLGALFAAGDDGAAHVLEFGCGTMELAAELAGGRGPTVGAYACVEPNAFLTDAGRAKARAGLEPHWAALQGRIDAQTVALAHNANFAPEVPGDVRFDAVYSHSVLSHAGTRTLDAYLAATAAWLADTGVAVASLCVCAECAAGDRAYAPDCPADGSLDWVYPWVSWHSPNGLRAAAARAGLDVLHVADDITNAMRAGMIQRQGKGDWHEWVVLAKPGMRLDAAVRDRLLAFGRPDDAAARATAA